MPLRILYKLSQARLRDYWLPEPSLKVGADALHSHPELALFS